MLPYKSDSVLPFSIVVLHCAVDNADIEHLIMERQQRGLCVCVCTTLIYGELMSLRAMKRKIRSS